MDKLYIIETMNGKETLDNVRCNFQRADRFTTLKIMHDIMKFQIIVLVKKLTKVKRCKKVEYLNIFRQFCAIFDKSIKITF